MSADIASFVLLFLFAVSIVVSYLAVRRGRLRLVNASVIGGAVNIVLLSAYITSQGVSLPQAITIGLALGLLFTMMSVTMGAYFLAHASDAPSAPTEQSGK